MEEILPIGIEKLTDDLKRSARTLTEGQVRYLVDYYYQMQDNRIRAKNQVRISAEEPAEWIDWVARHLAKLEGQIHSALDIYSDNQKLGQWSRSNVGVGPVITAGLLAHIDILQTPHAGSLHRYAGLDPTLDWLGKAKSTTMVNSILPPRSQVVDENHIVEIAKLTNRTTENIKKFALMMKGDKKPKKSDGDMGFSKEDLINALARRPWNARLKVLTWKIGESFVKVQNKEGAYYGQWYQDRRVIEEKANESGKYEKQALTKAETVGKSTDAYKFYSKGILPPAHIYSRTKRWVVKLFLSHYHHVGYEILHGKPPDRPWVIVHGGHSDLIPPPNW